MDGQPRIMGFYTTRFVEAETPEGAEDLAVQQIRGDDKLRKTVINDKSDPPMIYAEEIIMLETFEGIKLPGTGYTFFYDDETRGKA
jgi:hypothetical protein